ncbi:serine hydrolase [Acaryochloris sp. IP29b_bin.148]|uniref:serine hydrolase domain-containing protein n=1 Tax=Acaryochloris sp. IP29b_bin.148 TaxID=2969218 RepID=UPI002610F67A|nr:serine hydrolase [Acaryochloris sp. IP29b_bin.148]
MLIILAGLFSIGLVVTGGVVAWHWTFIQRILTYPDRSVTDAGWYTPMETLPGGNSPPIPKARPPISQAAIDQMTRYAEDHKSSAFLVMHQGKIVVEKYWRGHDSNAYTNSMSLAKTVLSLLIGIAIAEGDIQSELDPVAKYVPEWAKDDRAKITIQDLLKMQSGLRDYEATNDPFSDVVQMYLGTDAKAAALKVPAVSPPGQAFAYVNANSQILGLVLERATGQRYGQYLATKLWQPMGAQEAQLWLDRPEGNAKPFCCLFARSQDWLRVGQLLLNAGKVDQQQLVPANWIKKMITSDGVEPIYGYHIWLKARTEGGPGYRKMSTEPFLADDMFYLDGWGQQRVYVMPSQELVIVRVGDKPEDWDDAMIPNLLIRDLQAAD